jgi:hypothetical protein
MRNIRQVRPAQRLYEKNRYDLYRKVHKYMQISQFRLQYIYMNQQ